ncbi:hypothetical protein OG782_19290 [Streptomyces sp. NBC_00876]|uniref:hypothetical protein n=1 Tax=Streptomyces sp. NBC_00876 TaxID=2975853 RepID=UPI00386F37AF|nr:hypothetical protein OG782_19290 [Streptomyces sp. NBC_00876]
MSDHDVSREAGVPEWRGGLDHAGQCGVRHQELWALAATFAERGYGAAVQADGAPVEQLDLAVEGEERTSAGRE